MRGEYQAAPGKFELNPELPPRARRILLWDDEEGDCLGTTSACAENTPLDAARLISSGNYLRVRGEYDPLSTTEDLTKELPPRARRILLIGHVFAGFGGTTSACAENTAWVRP